MNNHVSSSVVRLISHNGTVAGIGYLVTEGRIITCAHMVALALGIPNDTVQKPDSEVTIDFPFVERGKHLKARVFSWRTVYQDSSLPLDGLEDVAVLEVVDEEPQEESLVPDKLTDRVYEEIIKKIRDGELVPFLGAGVNLSERPRGESWHPDSQFLPSGEELSRSLAQEFGYPWADSGDLPRVSQYVVLMHTLDRLNEKLRTIFNRDYEPTALHRFFASLPDTLRGKSYSPNFLIVTTNYDDLLERAFGNRPYDLISYRVGNRNDPRGKMFHWIDGRMRPIDDPNSYAGIQLDDKRKLLKPLILKVHGAVDRSPIGDRPRDSYVITEDHYLEYLTSSDISSLLPATLKENFSMRSFLFLGYSLRDWNLRVFLNRIQMQQRQYEEFYQSWAIQKRPGALEQGFWRERSVEIFDADLRDFIRKLEQGVDALPMAGGGR